MKYLALALALFLPLSSCVATQADIQDLRLSMEERDDEIAEAIEEYEAGAIDRAELDARLSAANAGMAASLDAKVDEIQERTSTVLQNLPTTGNGIFDLLVGAAGTIGASVVATNKVRDKRREKRGESTS